jgi:microcystin-dependent protein
VPVEITTTNNSFRVPTSGNDGSDFAAGLDDFATDVDKMWIRGTISSLPSASKAGRRYYATDIDQELIDTGSSWIPVGTATPVASMMQYAGSSDPVDADGTTRWLICDGRAISRTTYAALFNKTSTTYGTGNGSTTFNIPDLRQRLPLGKAASGTGSTLGATGGAIDHTHSTPSHSHTLGAGFAVVAFGLVGSTGAINWNAFASGVTPTSGFLEFSATGGSGNFDGFNNATALGGSTDSGGSGTSGTNNPPYLAVNHIIKVL